MSSIDRDVLIAALSRLNAAMVRDFDLFNTADGALGDGDLGITMKRGMAAIQDNAVNLPPDLGMALLQCAQAFTKSSGSSYGTLLATGLMAIAKVVKGNEQVDAERTSELIAIARDKMQERGKAELGGKTVLDSLNAVTEATAELQEPSQIADAAAKAVDDALVNFKNEKATVGRARIFAEKSVGMDDPGMLAMQRIIKALADREG